MQIKKKIKQTIQMPKQRKAARQSEYFPRNIQERNKNMEASRRRDEAILEAKDQFRWGSIPR